MRGNRERGKENSQAPSLEMVLLRGREGRGGKGEMGSRSRICKLAWKALTPQKGSVPTLVRVGNPMTVRSCGRIKRVRWNKESTRPRKRPQPIRESGPGEGGESKKFLTCGTCRKPVTRRKKKPGKDLGRTGIHKPACAWKWRGWGEGRGRSVGVD